MHKFENILLCTDLDGTLAQGSEISEKNISAINEFMKNGGLFTLCTGRIHNYLKDFFDKIEPNTLLITLNGAAIINHRTGEYLYRGYLKDGYLDAVDIAMKYSDYIREFFVYYENRTSSELIKPLDYINGTVSINTNVGIHKIVFSFSDETEAKKAEYEISTLAPDKFKCLRSWPTGVEIIDIESTKGAAVKRLKEYTGSKILVCVGDFENDMSMIKEADIGYAVGNAIPELKEIADRVTVPFNESAIAQIIKDLSNSAAK